MNDWRIGDPAYNPSMLEKKLTALGCVAAIVALGACAVGSSSPPPPPAPVKIAPTLDIWRVRSIRVAATNASSQPHLIPDEVALAFAIGWRAKHTGVWVHVGEETTPRESPLDVTVVSEDAAPSLSPDSPARRRLPVVVALTATLSSPNGNVIWHESAYQYSTSCPAPSHEAVEASSDSRADPRTDPWADPGFRVCVTNGVTLQLVDRLLHALQEPR